MNKRFKIGDYYAELPNGAGGLGGSPVQIIAEKPETLEPLEDAVLGLAAAKPVVPSMRVGRTASPAKTGEACEEPLDQRVEWQAFSGEKSVYPALWHRYTQGESKFCGFNVWAAIFGIQWFFFHKMYAKGVVAILLDVFVPVVLGLLGRSIFSHDYLYDKRAFAVACVALPLLAARFALGYWANLALLRRAQCEIEHIRSLSLSKDQHLSAITSAGAVSVPSVVLLYVVGGIGKIVVSAMYG